MRDWSPVRMLERSVAAVFAAVLLTAGFAGTLSAATALLGRAPADWIALGPAIAVTALSFPWVRVVSVRAIRQWSHGGGPAQYAVVADVLALAEGSVGGHPDLARIAEVIGRGLRMAYCRVTVSAPGIGEERVEWSPGVERSGPVLLSSVRYGGEQVGELAVCRMRFTRLNGRRRRLLGDLVDVLGPVLYNEWLGRQLQYELSAALDRAHQIASSRRRAIAEMDSERRALERNLHDGAQHHLVALQMTIGVLEHDVTHGRTDAARAHLRDLIGQVDVTSSLLVDTAAGVFPTMLADRGLVPALAAELRDAAPAVALDLDDTASGRRFPFVVETAIYFACLEAVNNARKHAPGARVTVTIRNGYRGLAFTVRDTGPGFRPHEGAGRGVRNILERIEAVGGDVTLSSAPGAGTVVDAFIPI
jgi:signal transduction histidine kinase